MLNINLSDICDQLILMNSADIGIENQARRDLEIIARKLCLLVAQGKSAKVTSPAISLIWRADDFCKYFSNLASAKSRYSEGIKKYFPFCC